MKIEDIKVLRKRKGMFLINWIMTRWCNYNCSYCNLKKDNTIKLIEIKKIARKINWLINNQIKENVYLKLGGGEISFLPLEEILNYIDSPFVKKIHITTNLSNNIEYYLNLRKFCNKRNIELVISASCHIEQIDNIDNFLEKAKYVSMVSFVWDEKYKDENLKIINYLEKNHILYTLRRLKDKDSNITVNKNIVSTNGAGTELTVILKNGESVSFPNRYEFVKTFNGNNFYNFYCNSGKYNIVILDGFIIRNFCSKFRNEKIDIFNYNKENIYPVLCDDNKPCSLCSFNYTISKDIKDCV